MTIFPILVDHIPDRFPIALTFSNVCAAPNLPLTPFGDVSLAWNDTKLACRSDGRRRQRAHTSALQDVHDRIHLVRCGGALTPLTLEYLAV